MVILHGLNQKAMEVVFLIEFVRQNLEKFPSLWLLRKGFCKFPQLRRPDANHCLWVNMGDQPAMKRPVLAVLQFKQPGLYSLLYTHISTPLQWSTSC